MNPSIVLKGLVHNYFYPMLPEPKIKYIIIGSARSGSTYLVSLLSSHPDMKLCGEVIGDGKMKKNKINLLLNKCGPPKYFYNQFKKHFFKSAVGVKVLYYQFKNNYGKKWNVEDIESILRAVIRDKSIKIIHLKRQNLLHVFLSNQLAMKTGEYAIRNPGKVKDSGSISLSPEKCERFFKKTSQNWIDFDEYFSEHSICEIYYQDLASNTESVCQKIIDFLGVRPFPLKGNTFKQSQKPISEKIENYGELKKYFKNTQWASFFDE